MFNISQFLEKFKVAGQKSALTRELIAQGLSEGLGVTILPQDFKIKDNVVVFLHSSGSLKSQIFIKKQELLRILREKCKEEAPSDIR
ncbi:MAG: hypothetical protein PHV93_02515 [Candidatus Pacebacteria bacterium]|nr:hypothetical protein [Candidatus Paceibacterota bacterium]